MRSANQIISTNTQTTPGIRPEEIAQLNESDEEEFKHEKPALNAKQALELNMNILSAMNAA